MLIHTLTPMLPWAVFDSANPYSTRARNVDSGMLPVIDFSLRAISAPPQDVPLAVCDARSITARDLLLALRADPLDVRQLAVDLAVIPVAVTGELKALTEAGLVHAVTMDSGRQGWGLTIRGRSRWRRAQPDDHWP